MQPSSARCVAALQALDAAELARAVAQLGIGGGDLLLSFSDVGVCLTPTFSLEFEDATLLGLALLYGSSQARMASRGLGWGARTLGSAAAVAACIGVLLDAGHRLLWLHGGDEPVYFGEYMGEDVLEEEVICALRARGVLRWRPCIHDLFAHSERVRIVAVFCVMLRANLPADVLVRHILPCVVAPLDIEMR